MSQTISVIVPVYNCRNYLPRCIESILAQSYSNLQVILVDDGSTDGSSEICDAFAEEDSRIQVIHQKNQGVSVARNAGMMLAEGAYLTFVDADDALASRAMETALDALQRNHADMVTYGWNIIREDGVWEQVSEDFSVMDDIVSILKEMLMHYSAYGGGYPWNKLWRRDALGSELTAFNSDLYYFEDLEWVVRMLLKVRRVVVCPECLYSYYIRENSVTHSREKAEHRELGYHHSMERIMVDLSVLPELQTWFSEKYYPEIVNGVIHAQRHNYQTLQKYLIEKMTQFKKEIIAADMVSWNIKLRCRILSLLKKLHIL